MADTAVVVDWASGPATHIRLFSPSPAGDRTVAVVSTTDRMMFQDRYRPRIASLQTSPQNACGMVETTPTSTDTHRRGCSPGFRKSDKPAVRDISNDVAHDARFSERVFRELAHRTS